MSDDIKIHKGLIMLAFGFLIALAAAAYVVAPKAGSDIQQIQIPDSNAIQDSNAQQPIQPSLAPVSAPAPRRGGCGCGGGGSSCSAGGVFAPDPSKAVILNTSSGQAPADAQDIYIKALSDGTYDKQELDVKKGVPVRLHFTADPNAGCGRSMVIYGMNIRAASQNGEESVVDFVPQQEGSYEISCGMKMWGPAKLVVS